MSIDRLDHDRLSPWWLPVLRAAGYSLFRVDPAHRREVEKALATRGVRLLADDRPHGKIAQGTGSGTGWGLNRELVSHKASVK